MLPLGRLPEKTQSVTTYPFSLLAVVIASSMPAVLSRKMHDVTDIPYFRTRMTPVLAVFEIKLQSWIVCIAIVVVLISIHVSSPHCSTVLNAKLPPVCDDPLVAKNADPHFPKHAEKFNPSNVTGTLTTRAIVPSHAELRHSRNVDS
jgi:hypothetical protein